MTTLIIVFAAGLSVGFGVGMYTGVQIQYDKCAQVYKKDLAFTVKKNRELREHLREMQREGG